MIGFLRGSVAALPPDGACLLDVGGVGWRVLVSAMTRARLRLGETVTLFTHLAIKENDVALYGFDREAEQALFEQLITVKGVGPTLALGVLSSAAAEQVAADIAAQRVSALTALPGIGKKTAERLVLELRDKLDATGDCEAASAGQDSDAAGEAAAALMALGYAQAEVAPVLRRLADQSVTDTAALVRAALRQLGGGK